MLRWGFFSYSNVKNGFYRYFLSEKGIHMRKQHYKRLIWLLSSIFLGLFILLARITHIQLISTESFSSHQINLIKKSVQQRQQQVILHSGRGEITDRYGKALTGKSTYVLVLFPLSSKLEMDQQKIEKVAQLAHISEDRLLQQIRETREPKIYHSVRGLLQLTEAEANQINELAIPGVLGLPYEIRYDPEQIVAQHLIGYIGQNAEYVKKYFADDLAQGTLHENSVIGISGLEKTFQPFLQGAGPTSLSYYVDGRGYPLHGMDIKYMDQGNPFYPLIMQTTLDLELQMQVEQLMESHQMKEGTAVILDSETSEILAMASRPHFLTQMNSFDAWENKAIKRLSPGSIFKIVIAAAALEKELVKEGEEFHCEGILEGANLHCWKDGGHGRKTFEEGFAESCNIVFGQLAAKLGPEVIEEYAQKLGLLDKNGWLDDSLFHIENFRQLDSEEAGQIYAPTRSEEEKNDQEYLLQTGIGQLDVQVTPLAVANMLATITKGGNKHQVKAVRDILYQTGGSFFHFPKKKIEGETISPYTAYQLQKLLAGVIDKGTASRLAEKEWKAAGKTGTAQVERSGMSYHVQQFSNHKWFAGYYPRNHPRYVIVVVNMNQPENARNASIDLFGDIVDWLEQNR